MEPIEKCPDDAAAYVLRALTADETQRFEEHLRSCSVCQAEVESLRELTESLAVSAPPRRVPMRLRRRVMSAVRADARARRPAPVRLPRARAAVTLGALAAVAAALVVIQFSGLGGQSTRVYAALVGSAEVRVSGDRAQLVVDHLPRLTHSQVYEVWLKYPHATPQPTRALFEVNANGRASVHVPRNVAHVAELMVTREPAGGSAVPTHAPVVIARIS